MIIVNGISLAGVGELSVIQGVIFGRSWLILDRLVQGGIESTRDFSLTPSHHQTTIKLN